MIELDPTPDSIGLDRLLLGVLDGAYMTMRM